MTAKLNEARQPCIGCRHLRTFACPFEPWICVLGACFGVAPCRFEPRATP